MGAGIVYFDVGGVLIKDFSKSDRWEELKRDWGVGKERGEEFDKWFDEVEAEVVKGKPLREYIFVMNERFGLSTGKDRDLVEDFVTRFERNEGIWPIVVKVKQRCKVGLLTNMYPGMLEKIRQRRLLPEVDWDVVLDSSELGVAKPDERIFVEAEKRRSTAGGQILFVENSRTHVEAGERRGWECWQFDSADYDGSNRKLDEWFRQYGI